MSGAASVVNTDTCSDPQETTWSAGESRTMQRWKYRHYFEFDSVNGDRNISAAVRSASEQAPSWHRNVKLTEKKSQDLPTDMTTVATTSSSTGRTSEGPSPAKQLKTDLRATGLGAAEQKKLVSGYIVKDMLPISTVESESFFAS